MAAKLNRTPGSVFVSVDAPPQKTAHASISADWKSIAHDMIAEAPAAKPTPQTAPVSTPEPRSPVSDNPVGDSMKALISEVDDRLDPKPRVNTPPINNGCYHYEPPIKPKVDYDSPLRAYWNRVMQRKSDERMAYLRQRVEPKPPHPTAQKPAIALNTNARGEVLNVFGDVVMEVA